MNEFFKKIADTIKRLWGKWSPLQRVILIGIAVLLIIGIIALFGVSSKPTMVSLFDEPIKNETVIGNIVYRINQENVKAKAVNGYIQVADEETARRMKVLLAQENLIPNEINPWDDFDKPSWTKTDKERDATYQRGVVNEITKNIKAINDIANATVRIDIPPKELFIQDQKPITAQVTIWPKAGSDITTNIKKIKTIHEMVKKSIAGIKDEDILISDNMLNTLNDFEDLDGVRRIQNIKQEQKVIRDQEKIYRMAILDNLQKIFTADRVRDLNIKIDMDMSKVEFDAKEYSPIVIRPRDPALPYDNSELLESIVIGESKSKTDAQGTMFNPEGPAGVEGQTPPSYIDLQNGIGSMKQETIVQNKVVNEKNVRTEQSPQMGRRTVSVFIDGTWKIKYDAKGNPIVLPDKSIEREYIPVSPEDLRKAEKGIRDAIGFDSRRGDSVTVENIQFDRHAEFKVADDKYIRDQQIKTTVLVFLSGLTILLVCFIIFRVISREMERRRRLAEDERSRREQMLRESAIAQAEEDGVDVSISVEERTRLELLESVINMAKEHPDDCAQLIRTWLLEE